MVPACTCLSMRRASQERMCTCIGTNGAKKPNTHLQNCDAHTVQPPKSCIHGAPLGAIHNGVQVWAWLPLHMCANMCSDFEHSSRAEHIWHKTSCQTCFPHCNQLAYVLCADNMNTTFKRRLRTAWYLRRATQVDPLQLHPEHREAT